MDGKGVRVVDLVVFRKTRRMQQTGNRRCFLNTCTTVREVNWRRSSRETMPEIDSMSRVRGFR